MSSRVQRSGQLVAYWKAGGFCVRNYATGTVLPADGAVLEILNRATRPVSHARLLAECGDPSGETIDRLIDAGFLQAATGADPSTPKSSGSWRSWEPEAAFFHFGTKDHPFKTKSDLIINYDDPPPAPLKDDPPGVDRIELPPFRSDGELPETLLSRRTWRSFDVRALSAGELATLLGLTWAVQKWGRGNIDPRLAFKTSPSGGAKHSIEVYVAALRVDGLEPATYHYCPDRHSLARVADAPSKDQLGTFLPGQPHYWEGAAVFFMTSVFARVQSKYKFPRAYRVILLEGGHLGQTFCLTATWLGLAPFCTAALGDSAIERHLGIDGVSESVIYVTGAGHRPAGMDWAPFGEGRPAPQTTPPAHSERRGE